MRRFAVALSCALAVAAVTAGSAGSRTAKSAFEVFVEPTITSASNGLLLEYHIARHLTDMEVVHTYEGTDNIQSLLIGRDITGIQQSLSADPLTWWSARS